MAEKPPKLPIRPIIPTSCQRGGGCKLDDLAFCKKGPFGSSLTKAMFVPKGNDTYKVYEQKNAIQKDCTLGTYYISKEKYDSLFVFSVQPQYCLSPSITQS